jgi:hypothetical protein
MKRGSLVFYSTMKRAPIPSLVRSVYKKRGIDERIDDPDASRD